MSEIHVPDKTWLSLSPCSQEFRDGLTAFVQYGLRKCHGLYKEGYLPCPCRDCTNRNVIPIVDLRQHIFMNGWLAHYVIWTKHGERTYDSEPNIENIVEDEPNEMRNLVCVAMGRPDEIENIPDIPDIPDHNDVDLSEPNEDLLEPNEDLPDLNYNSTFVNRLKDAEQELWPGCTQLAGPVHYRWMYPIERYLLTLKKYVRTRRHPEGSIAEKYLADESMTFCSRFLHNVETKSNRTERYIDGYYGASTHTSLTKLEHGQVHRYIIFNLDIIEIFRNLHIEDLKQRYPTITSLRLQKLHFKEFADWFETYVQKNRGKDENISPDICSISRGPNFFIKSYNGYILNGVKFLSFEVSNLKKTQNHGVLVSATTSTYLKNPNDDPKIDDPSYHGTLQKVYEVCYGYDMLKYTMFHCKWYDGFKKDEFGLVSVKTSVPKYGEEPFIFAEQAKQCFYSIDPIESNRSFVLNRPHRQIFDVDDV